MSSSYYDFTGENMAYVHAEIPEDLGRREAAEKKFEFPAHDDLQTLQVRGQIQNAQHKCITAGVLRDLIKNMPAETAVFISVGAAAEKEATKVSLQFNANGKSQVVLR